GLSIRWFDPIAEVSELPDHFPSAPLLGRNHCPCFLGQLADGIFYPPGRFSSERIEIEGDIGDRE
ncbi:MAG: hypothetical protein WAK48_01975, partial [Candidatus Acidiferrum sp.]